MKVEFELNLDRKGRPCIKFKHHDRENSLEQKALKVFLDAVKEKGCVLRNPSGYLQTGTSNSWENYEIQIASDIRKTMKVPSVNAGSVTIIETFEDFKYWHESFVARYGEEPEIKVTNKAYKEAEETYKKAIQQFLNK